MHIDIVSMSEIMLTFAPDFRRGLESQTTITNI